MAQWVNGHRTLSGRGPRPAMSESADEGEVNNFAVCDEPPDGEFREIGDEATWVLSSSKPGFGVANLRDNSVRLPAHRPRLSPSAALTRLPRPRQLTTYWQSDGLTPHTLTLFFRRRVRLVRLALYVNAEKDDSYTPLLVNVRAGTSDRDLEPVTQLNLESQPNGWVVAGLYRLDGETKLPLKAYTLQLSFEKMLLNGRDLHVRQLRLYAPRADAEGGTLHHPASSQFWSEEFLSYAAIR